MNFSHGIILKFLAVLKFSADACNLPLMLSDFLLKNIQIHLLFDQKSDNILMFC